MFFRKLCRNSTLPTEQESGGPPPQTSAGYSRAQTASVPVAAVVARQAAYPERGDLRNSVQLSGEQEAQGHYQRPLTPPPSYSSRCPSVAAPNRYEYDSSSSSDEGIEGPAGGAPLSGTHCPDLLHACSLILPSGQDNDSSDQGLSSSDYVEIDEFCQQFSQLNNHARCADGELFEQQRGCVTSSVDQAMGQNLSLRRPRISLTWVLREQQQNNSTNVSNDSKNTNERKKFKSKNKEEKLFSEKYVSDHNLQEYQDKREPTKDLLFVCSPQKNFAESHSTNEILDRRRKETRKAIEKRSFKLNENGFTKQCAPSEDSKSLKGTYSEPSLVAASEGNHRRHRHRKRRDRNRLQKFGYEIRNVDEFLSKCSLASPGNIPVVLSSSSTLYQTRPGGYQIEIPLPLGMVVNAVFKNQNWLYVQTPHAEEGYVGYSSCLPLGILPPTARANSTSRPPPCWESNGDVFPRPCGNMTDSEKEVRLRGGTRSDGARTPRLRRSSVKTYAEHHVDKLYLRAASQPKLTEKSYAQLRPVLNYQPSQKHKTLEMPPGRHNDEYVVLKQQKPRVMPRQCASHGPKTKSLRQTLVAITNDYVTESIAVRKGDIVTLLECKESKDRRQWFYIKTREGREGFIPAEFAGHGFL